MNAGANNGPEQDSEKPGKEKLDKKELEQLAGQTELMKAKPMKSLAG